MTRKKFASHHFSPRHITKISTHDNVVSASFSVVGVDGFEPPTLCL